ncbi:hypothetical protein C8Q74DRAFT_1265522 [Fomes fomentarius]|nr:hypothetical protein C8Q74DRAFT_1265522 [Fomes fomentarius]
MTFGEGTYDGMEDNGASGSEWANWLDPTTSPSAAAPPTGLPFPELPAIWPAAFAQPSTGEDIANQFIPPLSPSIALGELEDPIDFLTRMITITPTTYTHPATMPTFSSGFATDFFAFSAAPSPYTFPTFPAAPDHYFYPQADPVPAPLPPVLALAPAPAPAPAHAVGAGTPTLVLPDVIGSLVWESPDTVKTYIWDGCQLPPMPAILLWNHLMGVVKVLETSVGTDHKGKTLHRCLWPGCHHDRILRDNLRKHVQTVHQKLKRRCENPGCMFTERSDMFKTRHRDCPHGAPGVRPKGVPVLAPY